MDLNYLLRKLKTTYIINEDECYYKSYKYYYGKGAIDWADAPTINPKYVVNFKCYENDKEYSIPYEVNSNEEDLSISKVLDELKNKKK